MKRIFAILLLSVLTTCGGEEPASSGSQLPAGSDAALTESQRLNVWLDQQFEEMLEFSPQFRTRLGDKTDYDRLDDASEAADLEALDWRRASVAEMRDRFDFAQLDEQARLSWELWAYNLEMSEAGQPYWRHGYIFGRGGPHASLPNFMINYHRIDNEADARAYLARLREIPRVFDQLLSRSRTAADQGIRQPRFSYEFALQEIDRVTNGIPYQGSEDSPLWSDLGSKLERLVAARTLPADTASALMAEAHAILSGPVTAAYDELTAWLMADIDNATADARGVWDLPDGEAFYNYRLHLMTGLDLTADEIHRIGLSEVERLTGEMETIMARVEFTGSLQEFFVFMRENERFYLPNTDAGRQGYIDLATDFLDGMNERLPDYFGRLPRAELEVRRVEAFREQDGAAQHYAAGTPDGSRPGVFYAHLSDMNAMPVYQLEDVAYHEGSPGHHMQISIQQELTDIPRFRTQFRNTAYTEGWGLYAEYLAKEMGFFEDPYSDFGRVTGEIWRAIRLVVDTGLHAMAWSEEQAVDYMLSNSPLAEGAVRSEVRRYITGPGQATAYKIGMMEFLALREQARQALGEAFDIRAYHDLVLGSGALPMPILRQQVAGWIGAQQSL